MRLFSLSRVFICRQSGATLLETVVALAILGTIAVTFLSGLATTTKASFTTDERATAGSLAQSQMEWVQNASYLHFPTQYSPPDPSGKDYVGYSANITTALLPGHSSDNGSQKITVTISRSGEPVLTLESYKRQR